MKRKTDIEWNTDRYLAIATWARRRYTDKDGRLLIQTGSTLHPFARIEIAAWRKYVA